MAVRLAAATTEPTIVLHLAAKCITQVTILKIPELQGMVMGGNGGDIISCDIPSTGGGVAGTCQSYGGDGGYGNSGNGETVTTGMGKWR